MMATQTERTVAKLELTPKEGLIRKLAIVDDLRLRCDGPGLLDLSYLGCRAVGEALELYASHLAGEIRREQAAEDEVVRTTTEAVDRLTRTADELDGRIRRMENR